jgi:hypothetical protein
MNAVTWISFQDELEKIAGSDELKGAMRGAAMSGLTAAGVSTLWNLLGGRKFLPISVGGTAAFSAAAGAYGGTRRAKREKQLKKFLREHDIRITPKPKTAAVRGAPKVKGIAQLLKMVSLRYPEAPKPPSFKRTPRGDVIS